MKENKRNEAIFACIREKSIVPSFQRDLSVPPRAFISYARSDGESFASSLRQKLELSEPEISLWQDRIALDGGIGWWKQITEALDKVQFLIIIITHSVFDSEIAIKEWRYARQQGVQICPVFGVPSKELDFNALPKWVQKTHIYDLEKEWETFTRFLKSAPTSSRVPFMAPDVRDGFVARPKEFNALLSKFLDDSRINPEATITALQGAGGFGKTTLAVALCNSNEVISAFDDGVLWATLGETPKIQDELTKLYAALTGERPSFIDVDDASIQLAARLDQKNCLIVIDDVWDPNHLKAFLRGGKQCARLVTTRHRSVVIESSAYHITVDEMTEDQSITLLTSRLLSTPSDVAALRKLSCELGEWPLLLRLASSLWVERVQRGESVDKALDYVVQTLEKRGVTGFDRYDATERNDAVTRTIAVSLERLSQEDQLYFIELAIFPEDRLIPISAVCALWQLDEFDADDVLRRLDGAALLDFDLKSVTVRIHDVLQKYLHAKMPDTKSIHKRLIHGAWKNHRKLPDEYAWRSIGWHLYNADELALLRALLWDINWLQEKIQACDVHALLQDFDFLSQDKDLRHLQDAIRLSANGLSRDPRQLPAQLVARLDRGVSDAIDGLLDGYATSQKKLHFGLKHSSLTHAGGALISILKGHTLAVEAIATVPGSCLALTASADYTLRLWDLVNGRSTRVLEGHRAAVHCVAVSEDGSIAVSGSEDRILIIWDLSEAKQLKVFRAQGSILQVALSPDGRMVVSASDDAVICLWDVKSGKSQVLFKGHSHQLSAVAFSPSGRHVLAGAGDVSMILVEVATGKVVRIFNGHKAMIRTVVFSNDGKFAVSGSVNGTLRLWDVDTAQTLSIFEGHRGDVECVAITPDNKRIVSGSRDQTIRIWGLHSGVEQQVLEGHAGFVRSVAITQNGSRLVSASGDQTVRLWDLEITHGRRDMSGSTPEVRTSMNCGLQNFPSIQPLRAHPEPVSAMTMSVNGKYAISGSRTSSPRCWDVAEDRVVGMLYGHTGSVVSIIISPDGTMAITAGGARDRTIRVWDLKTQETTHSLVGHRDGIVKMSVAWIADRLLSFGRDRTLKLWDVQTGKLLRELSALTPVQLQAIRRSGRVLSEEVDSVSSLDVVDKPFSRDTHITISPDGTWAVAGSAGTVYLWNLNDGSLHSEALGDFDISHLEITLDGKHVLIGAVSGVVAIWEIASKTLEFAFADQTAARVLDVRMQENSDQLVCAFEDNTIRFWDKHSKMETGVLAGLFDGVDDSVIASNAIVAYSIYGDTIVASDLEQLIHLGSISLDYGITALAVVPDGTRLAVGDESGTVHFLTLERH